MYATLGENFTLTCSMVNSMDGSVKAVRFFRDESLTVAIGFNTNNICEKQSANPNYTYECISEYIFTLTIPAEKMTEAEQSSEWRCGHIFNSSNKSPAVILQIASKYNIYYSIHIVMNSVLIGPLNWKRKSSSSHL